MTDDKTKNNNKHHWNLTGFETCFVCRKVVIGLKNFRQSCLTEAFVCQ